MGQRGIFLMFFFQIRDIIPTNNPNEQKPKHIYIYKIRTNPKVDVGPSKIHIAEATYVPDVQSPVDAIPWKKNGWLIGKDSQSGWWYMQCGAPKIAKLPYKLLNYGL